MKNSELKELLSHFPDDAEISLLLEDPKKRKLYTVKNVIAIISNVMIIPYIGTEETKKASEEDQELEGQMEIGDYPGVMP
jgi:hypothetical protein